MKSPLATGERHRDAVIKQLSNIHLPEIQTQRTSEKTAQVSWFSNPVGCKRDGTEKKSNKS